MSSVAKNFWQTLPLVGDVELLGHDGNGLGALAKSAGVLSHPNEPGRDRGRALLDAEYDLEAECFIWTDPASGDTRRLWLLNRLDSATSGVILVAADGKLAADVKAQFQRKAIAKTYVALVFGTPRVPRETWRDRLAVERKGGVVRSSTSGGHIPAESDCRVLRSARGPQPLALLELKPRTGRTHQLRVQCARRQLPIVGDQTYGDFRRNREFAKLARTKRLFLHSLETQVRYQWAGREWSFAARAELPAEFEAALQA
ncbi:MAG: RNA pseudouridine synthase [Opitutaceae bacterium]